MNQSKLLKLITYSPCTGEFLWKSREPEMFKNARACKTWNTRYANKPCGLVSGHNHNLYLYIRVLGKRYAAHRLAWLYMTGDFPKSNIDHIDGDGLNNKFENLRDVSHSENSKNMRFKKSDVGVYLDKRTGRYKASIQVNKKYIYLGTYDTKEEALAVRRSAQETYKFSKFHGEQKC